MMESTNAPTGQAAESDGNANPFTASSSKMFNDFEKAKTETPTA